MAKRIGKPEDATPRWIDLCFPISETVSGRLRGEVNHPEDAHIILTRADEEGAEVTAISGLTELKRILDRLIEFISKMESPEVH